jgi:Uma2 family endonuclease
MTQALLKLVEFEEFLAWKPESRSYELHERLVVEMQQTGKHEEIARLLATEFVLEYKRLNLPYFIPKTPLIKPTGKQSGYSSDILVLNRSVLSQEELWSKYSLQLAESIPLIVEVVLKDTASHISTN